jgi:hypothetical protein
MVADRLGAGQRELDAREIDHDLVRARYGADQVYRRGGVRPAAGSSLSRRPELERLPNRRASIGMTASAWHVGYLGPVGWEQAVTDHGMWCSHTATGSPIESLRVLAAGEMVDGDI